MTPRIIALLIASVLVAPPASWAQQNSGKSFDSNGVQIQYAEKGSGEPVVLIHGFTGSYARHIEAPGLMDRLEKAGYRAIAMDCRGHGQSGKPPGDSQYGMEMVRDVIRLMDHLKIERAHLFGYSMGGAIASQLLVRQPDRLLTVTLLGAGWEGEDLKVFRSQMQELADGFAKRDASALIRGVNAGQTPTEAEVAALNASMFARNDPQALAAVARGMTSLFDIPADKLRATTVPVLAIVGEHDGSNVIAVKRMASVVPKMEVVLIPGANHATSVRPSAEHLVAFLDKHRLTKRGR
ncbi:MAG: alpha/beta fold hydrolase [Vicinamibacterales bacterium]